MSCIRFDSTVISFDSTEVTFDTVCIENGAISLLGAIDISFSAILVSSARCYLDGDGILHLIPDSDSTGRLNISGEGSIFLSPLKTSDANIGLYGNGSVFFIGGTNKGSSVLFSGEGIIRLYPGKYITGSIEFDGEGNLIFKRQTELIIRESPVDLWAEYELRRVSAITDLVSFNKNTVTLSMKLQSQIK